MRELCVTGNGDHGKYAGLNLKGASLPGADLRHADFTESDLSGANLTGACPESWNIGATTRLEGAQADFVFLKSDPKHRLPSDKKNFEKDEFAKLFTRALKTIEIIFEKKNWPAFLVAKIRPQ